MSLGEGLPVSYTRIFLFSLLLMVAEGGDIHQGGCRKPSVDKRASSACGDPPERWKKAGESNVYFLLVPLYVREERESAQTRITRKDQSRQSTRRAS